jgi:molybdopterin-guanine dinucleotide biosynthesis protein
MVANSTRCEIPLPASEVQQIARSVSRYEPESDIAADSALGAHAANQLLAPVQLSDFDYSPDTLKATEYVIDGFIGMGLTILAGEPGGGKTSIIVPLMAHAAHLCDKNHFLKPELRRHVIYVSEDTEQVERCIYAMKKYGKINIDSAQFKEWFHIREAHRSKPEHLASLLEDIDQEFTYRLENGFKVKPVVIFDTSNATIEIENENDNSEVGKVIAKIKQSSNGLAVVVVAHTAKALQRTDLASLTPRGASAWIGDARATIYLFSDESVPEARFLALGKRRFEPTYTEIRFDSETYTEVVATPWGSNQSVGLRVVTAEASSQEERKAAAKAGKQAANSLKQREQELVILNQLRSLPRDEYRTMNELIEQLKGTKVARMDIVHSLINRGEIEQFTFDGESTIQKRQQQHKNGIQISLTYEQESNG